MKIKVNTSDFTFSARTKQDTEKYIRIISEYLAKNKSIEEIAVLLKKNYYWVEGFIQKYKLYAAIEQDCCEIVKTFEEYKKNRKPAIEIARKYNRDYNWVIQTIEKYNIDYPGYLLGFKLAKKQSKKLCSYRQIPSFVNKQMPLKEIACITGLSIREIMTYIYKKYNCMPDRLYTKMNTAKENFKIIEQIKSGAQYKYFSRSYTTITRRLSKKFIDYIRPSKEKLLNEKAPYMIQEGLSGTYISKSLGVSFAFFERWLIKNYGMSLLKIRKNLGIKPKKNY